MSVLELRYYLARDGRSPFAGWFASLDPKARAKVTVAIGQLEQGNLSNVKAVGEGVLEYRINFGPGYRVYFGRDGEVLVVVLTGGMKSASRGTSRRLSRCGRITGAANAVRDEGG